MFLRRDSILPISVIALSLAVSFNGRAVFADEASTSPMLVGAQYTFVTQQQLSLHSPYAGPLSLDPSGDAQPSHTLGGYFGWTPAPELQLYMDVEKFMGAGVSNATGLGGLTNGDVVRGGVSGLRKEFYIARGFARLLLSLNNERATVERGQDQLPGMEPTHRLELKFGRLAASDDFDRNRYAGSTRTQFMNWALWDDPAWDYAANTRGFTDGVVIGYASTVWSIKYGLYRMPVLANHQQLIASFAESRGENVELALSPGSSGLIVRLLAYRNIANMGNYREALMLAQATHASPDIISDDREGRHKTGFGINVELPLADQGETGVFVRAGRNDGKTESFAFTEADQHVSAGLQLSGARWQRNEDRLGAAIALNGLSEAHRDYLAAGGSGFVLDDGTLRYGQEQIMELFYRAQYTWTPAESSLHLQLGPDFQYIHNPGYNRDRGPARFWALRAHVEY